jgi:hypothetical protein
MRRATFSILLGLVALAVFVPRLYPTMAPIGDSAEVVTAAAVFGVPHPPGYSLYVALGHAAIRLGGDPAWTMHLTSAIFHAAAVALVAYAVGLLTGSAAAMAVSAVTLLLSRSFLLGSLYAEVFPLNDLFFAWLLAAALSRSRAPPDHGVARLFGIAALLGTALAHHQMMLLGLPALALLLRGPVLRAVAARPSRIALLTAGMIPPLAISFALLPWAAASDPLISWGDVHDLESLAHLVTRADYGGLWRASRGSAEGQLLERLDVFFAGLGRSLGAFGLAMAAIGAWWALARSRIHGAALLLAFAVSGPVFAAMNAVDIHSEARVAFFERFTTMCHVPLGMLIGCGASWVEQRLSSYAPRRMVRGALAFIAALPLVPHLRIDCHEDRLGLAYAHDLVRSTPDGSLLLLTGDMPSHAALYVCGVERACGHRVIVSPLQLRMPWKAAQVKRRHPELATPRHDDGSIDLAAMIRGALGERPVFVSPELLEKEPALARSFSWSPALLLLRAHAPGLVTDTPSGFREDANDACEACSMALPALLRPSMEAQIFKAYLDAPAGERFRVPPWKGP